MLQERSLRRDVSSLTEPQTVHADAHAGPRRSALRKEGGYVGNVGVECNIKRLRLRDTPPGLRSRHDIENRYFSNRLTPTRSVTRTTDRVCKHPLLTPPILPCIATPFRPSSSTQPKSAAGLAFYRIPISTPAFVPCCAPLLVVA